MNSNTMHTAPYRKLLLTLAISFFVMYATMFLNVADTSHIYISTNRVYMAVLMVCPMTAIMVLMMKNMYTNKRLNTTILFLALVFFTGAFVAVRKQFLISDEQYMRGMIPHHSSAILTSTHANIRDPRVKKLADGIIASQQKEIAEMKELLQDMDK